MPLGVSGKMSVVRFGIVDGEPGIFPDPIARLLRLFGRPFRARPAEVRRSAG